MTVINKKKIFKAKYDGSCLRRQRQALCEFKGSLLYRESSKIARITEKPVSKQQEESVLILMGGRGVETRTRRVENIYQDGRL